MRFTRLFRYGLPAFVLGSIGFGKSSAQDRTKPDPALEEAVIVKLSPLNYPKLALQSRISGDVELEVEVRPDGSVASGVALSGHPLLKQAALENARQSLFECENCGEQAHSFRLTYAFEFGPTKYCTDDTDKPNASPTQVYPRVSQSKGHVTVVEQPAGTCDPVETIITYKKVRSAKCLYLWKCAKPRVVFNY